MTNTNRTTQQWEELLNEGTELAPSPWMPHPQHCIVRDNDNEPIIGWEAAGATEEELSLIASAPDAVAEVIRLRKALENMHAEYKFIWDHVDHPQARGILSQIDTDLTSILDGA